MAKKPLKMFKVNNISEVRDVDALYCIKTATDTEFSIVVTDAFGAIVNLKDLQTPAGIQGIASDDGTIEVTGTTFKNIRLSATLVNAINSALKPGDNISDLINDAGYLTSFTEIDPIFQASEASNFVSGDKANLDNQSGVNTGDETTSSIQSKRPLKTVDNKSLEGTGNIEIDYNTVINKPTEFPPSTHTHTISEVINLQNELNSKENISNKVNTISGNSSTEYPTEKAVVDYVSSQIGADFAKVVYFDNVTPNVASIFDLNNPPLVNDPSLKEDVANLYIGTDASTWVYVTSPAGYVTKTVTSSGSNFYITGTNTDAGSIKTGSITKKGQIVIDSEVVNDSGLTLKKTESSILKTDSLGKVVKATNLQDVEYAPIAHTHTVSEVTDFPTFKTIENQSIIGAGNIDLDKASVGLGNVDNTSDLNKIISTATQTALNAKANISGQVFTGAVSATNLSGTNTGDNAPNSLYSGLVTNATHTGEVTGSTALTITNGAVTNAKLANVATSTLKGRVAAATGVVEDLTASQVRTLLNVADGANNYVHPANHLASIITQDASNRFVTDTEKSAWNAKEPAIASGTISQYWRGDKTWQPFPAQATVDQTIIDGSTNSVSGNAVFDGLALKSNIGHTHVASQITDLSKASVGLGNVDNTSDLNKSISTATQTALDDLQLNKENKANKNIANGYAGLDSSGKIIPTQLPALAITDTFVVNSQAAMLALVAEVGDVAVRTDLNKSFILRVTGASTLANWQELLSPTSVDQTIIDGSTNAVSSNAVFDGLATKAPISSVHNPVTLGTANGLSLSTQQLSLGLASSSTTGALSGTDWNTFNNKENAFSKNTAFNKNFGTTAGTVVEGNYPPAKDGTGASGTWGININGSANNSILWNGLGADFSTYGSDLFQGIGYDSTEGKAKPYTASEWSSWLGLGTNAYSSTAYLPLSGGTVSGTISAYPATTANQVVVKSQLDAVAARPYKVYTAFYTQQGTANPSFTVLENTIGSVSWSRTGTGTFVATSSNLFTLNKTFITTLSGTTSFIINATTFSSSDVGLNFLELTTGNLIDGVNTNKNFVEIRVYN